ncbi:mitochondrial fission ELM1 family protein [Pontibacterium granulatum]|uniref:mitochondrial fission ELM1 family protein n=1 Tax=Pontibacterium granulatum TaxID=2036029 RepID=UPI002499D645|nr:mitochondrial fission ELM1 family protein [Pontibacterium granulatum]MDI3324622.1 mitochondrial fission ELM1 family protein [Pontibacterium granulatum]
MTQIWIISDGKPGHLNQSLGLAEALQRQIPNVHIETKPALSRAAALKLLCLGGVDGQPDLLIGAGHSTHLSLLAYKRATGAPAVLMMKPSLPMGWFDLCLIPKHDEPGERTNVVLTDGALNRMQPLAERQSGAGAKGMILIGGPSKHFGWDDQRVVDQLKVVVDGSTPWLLTTSRRTPESFLPLLQQAGLPDLEVVPFEQTGPGWLGEHLPQMAQCWVSGDSVSMVFESLTAGSAVGILELPPKASNRITRGLQLLIDDHKVTPFSRWQESRTLPLPEIPFNEAERCAELVRTRLLS